MQWRELANHDGERTYILVFQTGDEAVEGIQGFAKEQALTAARLTAIGAFSFAVVGYFDWETKDYQQIPIDEQVEVLTLAGDIALNDGQPTLHAHAVLGRSDGTTRGGHLLKAHIRPTLEVMLETLPVSLRKRYDPTSGLALIDPEG